MGRLRAPLQSVLLPQQSLPGCWKLFGRATYLHCLQHLVVRELARGVLDALHAERSLDYFASIPFKLWIKEESRLQNWKENILHFSFTATGAPAAYERGNCCKNPKFPATATLSDTAWSWTSCSLSCFWSSSFSDLILRSLDSWISICLCKEEMAPVKWEYS